MPEHGQEPCLWTGVTGLLSSSRTQVGAAAHMPGTAQHNTAAATKPLDASDISTTSTQPSALKTMSTNASLLAAPSSSSSSSATSVSLASSKQPSQPPPAKKRYDPAEFTFSRVVGGERVKMPGSIPPGMPFAIEDCKDASLFVLDASAQTTVDACENSVLVIGPCEGPVFIRDCSNCTVVCAAHQLRLRGCKDMRISLYVATQPIIETSTNVSFACYEYTYPALQDQFKAAKLDPSKNVWWQVYDFNDSTGANWHLADSQTDWPTRTPQSTETGASASASTSVVPHTSPSPHHHDCPQQNK
ncbi:tubulin binding cofactor C-domain-containing protein, partial [Entophlyctis helioformis]